MTNQDQNGSNPKPSQGRRVKRISLRPVTIILFLTVNLIVLVFLGWPYLRARYHLPFDLPWEPSALLQLPADLENTAGDIGFTLTLSASIVPTASATQSALYLTPSPSEAMDVGILDQGLIILSLQEGLDSHLFSYRPIARIQGGKSGLTRLTDGSWEDITPAFNPNHDQLAFASNQTGHWEIHLLELESGNTTPITTTSEYDASPSWSPDGLWMAFEGYIEDSLDILIRPVDGSQEPIQLTSHFAADYAPAWSPLGRQIAFVSTRGGSSQIWVANLDESGEDRFIKLSGHTEANAAHPVWSPDGRFLSWGAITREGLHNIYIWDSANPETKPRESGSGDWAVWSPDGEVLLIVLQTPYQSYLTAYSADQNGTVILAPVLLPGAVTGLTWADRVAPGVLRQIDQLSPTPLWDDNVDAQAEAIGGRWDLNLLDDVEAPYPRLHDRVDDSFQAMRKKLASLVGWDLLASLENAFLPLTSALSPGLGEDWLYTGRAFTFNTLPINAGWMAVVREDYGQKTFWRVYLRARFQDGSQGKPLQNLPWNFNARYSGQPRPYDQGGEIAADLPGGYWVDMTQLAAIYGWERLPALDPWRAVYANARFNEFVKTDSLDWVSAMLEIYPEEVLLTLTPVPTATPSVTPAPLWYRSPTPTSTQTATPTGTSTPTATISHTPTPTDETATGTADPRLTPSPTATATPAP